MEVIDGAAHMSMLENPKALGLAISNFLESLN
jgi:pimeloyl-ACP methyl ester carboxylesterase